MLAGFLQYRSKLNGIARQYLCQPGQERLRILILLPVINDVLRALRQIIRNGIIRVGLSGVE
jgi:hypothetical protein